MGTMPQPQQREIYSYQDFLSWPEWPMGDRIELIHGVAYSMSPAPLLRHQQILGEMYRQIANALADHRCHALVAPTDVKLSPAKEDDAPTVVEPDILVVCDDGKLTRRGIEGAPDLVIEIVSPDSGMADRKRKFDVYEHYGVREYWIVDPDEKVVEVYRIAPGQGRRKFRRVGAFGSGDSISIEAVPAVAVDLKMVFGAGPG